MKAVIEILPDKINAGNCILICEVSNEGFAYLIKDDESNLLVSLAVYHFNTPSISENYISILKNVFGKQTLFSENFNKVFIIYSFPESVLVPFPLYNSQNNADVLNLLYGDLTNNDALLTDVIEDLKVYNNYRIPSALIEEISRKFPSGIACHQYSALIKNLSATGNKLSIIFYPQKIVVMIEKEGKLHLINSFYYKTSEDVSYILLNACRQLEIKNMIVEVSGLIEKDSAIYKEIYKYFKPVSFGGLPPGTSFTEGIAEYPSHFFSHFFAVVSCE